MSFTDNDAQRLIDIIDERVERKLRDYPQVHWAVVATTPTGNRISVYLFGETTNASDGFIVPGWMRPAVGDLVRVRLGANGDRYVEEVYGSDPHAIPPSGTIVMTGAAAAPTGWLLCNGSAVSRTTYASLFAAIGTTYGAGNGSTTFNLPDLRGRFALGKAASGTGATLGSAGGSIDHAHSGPSHTHTNPTTGAEASHTHDLGTGAAQIRFDSTVIRIRHKTGLASWSPSFSWTVGGSVAGAVDQTIGAFLVGDSAAGSSHAHTQGSTGSGGTGNTGTNNPPYQVVNYIIRT